jgi:hypothetical protein
MKLNISLIVIFLSAQLSFASGSTIGNGGNLIVCTDPSGKINTVQLLDYFELEQNGGKLNINTELPTYEEMLLDIFNRWRNVAPIRMKQYTSWLQNFSSEAGFYSGVQIPPTEDTGVISIPKGCTIQPGAFQRPDSQLLPGVKRYIINKDLWDLMSDEQKAGLVLHELIYREGIIAGHSSSFSTRYFNGYLAAANSDPEKYSYIVYQMPLNWVEIGGGPVMTIGHYLESGGPAYGGGQFLRESHMTEDGYFSGHFRDIKPGAHHIKTKKLDLTLFLDEQTYSILIENHKEHFKIEGLDYSNTKIKLMERNFEISIDLFSMNLKGILLKDRNCRLPLSAPLQVDPVYSWFINEDGSKIEKIVSIKNDWGDSPTTLTTSDGSIWKNGPHDCKFTKQ